MELGNVIVTHGVADAMTNDMKFAYGVRKSFDRYQSGDWGELCDEDREQNEIALKNGSRVFASYELQHTEYPKIWIITEWDRSVTTILFPEEY